MKVKYASLREPVVLPMDPWNKGQGVSYSTLMLGNSSTPEGMGMEEQGEKIVITHNGTPVAAVPLGNIRGYVYDNSDEPVIDTTVVESTETEPPAETPRKRRG